MKRVLFVVVVTFVFCAIALAQTPAPAPDAAQTSPVPSTKTADDSIVIPKGAKVFVASMPDKFDEFVKSALEAKKVPVTVVDNRDQADFEISGFSETQKAGAAKKIIMGSWHSRESASIKVANLKSGVIAFAYSYNTDNSRRGKKSSSEACAKHLKEKIESGK